MSHPDQEVLVRLVDGEVSALERAALAAHVEQCPECVRARGAIEERSRALVDLLTRTDPEVRVFALARRRRPSRMPSRRWPVAAAIVLLLGAAALLVTPVRAWILDRWAGMRRVIGVSEPTSRAQPSRVSFVPGSNVLVVRVANRQASGDLLLEATDSPRVSAEVRGAGDGVELTVLPDELRIANAPGARASYRIAVPARLERITVLIAGEVLAIVAPVRAGERHTVNLAWVP